VLTGGIGHDFNNLAGSIVANSELAQPKLASGFPADEEIRDTQKVAGRAAEIVRQMMAYAALESVDLSRLVGEMLRLLQVSISKKITLKMDPQEASPRCWPTPRKSSRWS
jgi:hypothetical protein